MAALCYTRQLQSHCKLHKTAMNTVQENKPLIWAIQELERCFHDQIRKLMILLDDSGSIDDASLRKRQHQRHVTQKMCPCCGSRIEGEKPSNINSVLSRPDQDVNEGFRYPSSQKLSSQSEDTNSSLPSISGKKEEKSGGMNKLFDTVDSHPTEKIKLLKKPCIDTTSQKTGQKYKNRNTAGHLSSSTQCAESTPVRAGLNPQQKSDELVSSRSYSDDSVMLLESSGGPEDPNFGLENPIMGSFLELLSINSTKRPGSSGKSRGILMQSSDTSSRKLQEKYKAGTCDNTWKPRGLSLPDARLKSRRLLGIDVRSSSLSNSNAIRSEYIDHISKIEKSWLKSNATVRITLPDIEENIAESFV